MKISKKEAGIVAIVIIAIFGVSFVFAGNEGVPFDEIWEAITGVQQDVADIQTTLDLHALIATLEARIVNLETNLGALEFVPGPQGITGPQGATGLTGQEGPTGPMGCQGPEGHRGEIGPPGPAGEIGLPGPKGDTGAKGDKGSKGDTGLQGPSGPVEFGEPDYDSGWKPIGKGKMVYLELKDEYELSAFVYVLGKCGDDSAGEVVVIHQMSLGGEVAGNVHVGLTWCMTDEDVIELHRFADDDLWEQVRVMIWKLP